MQSVNGGCLCGAVRYQLLGECRPVVNCFCGQCQKTSGHYVAATRVSNDQLILEKATTLKWYQSSAAAKRGFCSECGSSLFWKPFDRDTISIMAGTIDKPTGLDTAKNIFVEDANDYHNIPPVSERPEG